MRVRRALREQTRRRDAHRGEHANRRVRAMRDERARRDDAAVARRRHEDHLRHGLLLTSPRFIIGPTLRRIASIRAFSSMSASSCVARLVAGAADVAGAHDDDRHAVVDAGDLDAVDDVHRPAGRQQRAARRSGGVGEAQRNRRRRPGHAVDARGRRRTRGFPPGVCTVATTVCDALTMKMRTLVTGSQPRTRPCSIANGATPARMLPQFCASETSARSTQTCRTGSRRRCPGAIGPRDDRDLAGQRIGAADAVDLPRVWRSHHREQDAIAVRDVGGKIGGEEVGTLRSAASHHRAGDGCLHGFCMRSRHAGPALRCCKPPLLY